MAYIAEQHHCSALVEARCTAERQAAPLLCVRESTVHCRKANGTTALRLWKHGALQKGKRHHCYAFVEARCTAERQTLECAPTRTPASITALTPTSTLIPNFIPRVGQNHIYTVYIRYFWQGNHEIYGHIRCIYTVLANPIHTHTHIRTHAHTHIYTHTSICTHTHTYTPTPKFTPTPTPTPISTPTPTLPHPHPHLLMHVGQVPEVAVALVRHTCQHVLNDVAREQLLKHAQLCVCEVGQLVLELHTCCDVCLYKHHHLGESNRQACVCVCVSKP